MGKIINNLLQEFIKLWDLCDSIKDKREMKELLKDSVKIEIINNKVKEK